LDGSKFFPENVDPFLCTHIIFAFADLIDDRLVPFEWNDHSNPWLKGLYERTIDLKKINPNLKVLLAVGGSFLVLYEKLIKNYFVIQIKIKIKDGTWAQTNSAIW
jgi:hypothetical protein